MRALLVIATIAVCLGAGTSAALVAYAAGLHWPLSEANLNGSVRLGLGWGASGALFAALVLSSVDRKRLWAAAAIAVAATWLITFAAVWWFVASSLG